MKRRRRQPQPELKLKKVTGKSFVRRCHTNDQNKAGLCLRNDELKIHAASRCFNAFVNSFFKTTGERYSQSTTAPLCGEYTVSAERGSLVMMLDGTAALLAESCDESPFVSLLVFTSVESASDGEAADVTGAVV